MLSFDTDDGAKTWNYSGMKQNTTIQTLLPSVTFCNCLSLTTNRQSFELEGNNNFSSVLHTKA
eukprot:m.18864 g.18864  ORF g.18864 m.18864 type:complete len:63 (-) comp7954_c0_seq1:126-314(-)